MGQLDVTQGRSPRTLRDRDGHTLSATAAGLLLLLLLFTPLIAWAQQASKVPRIGVLWGYSPSDVSGFAESLREGLRRLGYVEGRNIVIEERWSEGRSDRLPSLAAELARLNVDIIVAASTPAARAAHKATRTIPIVLTLVTDPVEGGLVASLARPGGNVTGMSMMSPELSGKRLAMLKEVVPTLSRVAILRSSSTPSFRLLLGETETAARALGVQVQVVEVREPTDFDRAFSVITRERVGALVVLPDAMFRNQRKRIVDFAATNRLPTVYAFREFVESGGLMSYGPDLPDMHRQVATFVDRILKGAKPADLPIEQPSTFEFVVNRKALNALGLTVPQHVLFRADRVIE